MLSPTTRAFVSSSLVLGITFGAILAVILTEHIGRRLIVIISGFKSFIFAALLSAMFQASAIIGMRLLQGVGIGCICTISCIYVMELASDKYKETFVFLFQVSICSGHVIGYLMNIIFNYVSSRWRYEFAIAGIPILTLGIGGIFCQEKLIVGAVLAFFDQFTGINVVIFYIPMILEMAKLTQRLKLLSVTLGIGVWNALLTLPPLILLFAIIIFHCYYIQHNTSTHIEKTGRKSVLIVGSAIQTVGSSIIAIGYLIPSLVDRNLQYVLAIPGLIIFIAGFEFGIGGVFYVLIAEMFPSKVAGVVTSMNMLILWICTVIVVTI
ncbi:MAG: putative sugar porter family MFS transporter [Streblomastix strix]|uniref:Putative sugar porter family MFS transporter n=1 Tax=Streblomastix strix TaxID=222440 RepID=A0A5J4X750_9EUKA|nr:MAG: putative sugar porter family MFS transporter [Streblomastix strix]KAA6402833.1 MAG: putative sugar porter family MFS transporter [Streblomastix strix]